MPKILEFDEHARRALERGVDALANGKSVDSASIEKHNAAIRGDRKSVV